MISFLNLASGSKGNATLLFNENTLLLVDMGVSRKLLEEGLSRLGKGVSDIAAIFITHEHSDHIKGLETLHEDIPLFAGEKTFEKAHRSVKSLEKVSVGSFEILPLSTSHDARSPFGFLFSSGGERLLYMTDTGVVPDEDLPYMADCDYYVFESNYDHKMLMHSNRPLLLKQRIAGETGHLSNVDSALTLSSLLGPKTKGIYLAHLSEECNTPEIALSSYQKIFRKKEISFPAERIVPLKQWEMTFGGDKR